MAKEQPFTLANAMAKRDLHLLWKVLGFRIRLSKAERDALKRARA